MSTLVKGFLVLALSASSPVAIHQSAAAVGPVGVVSVADASGGLAETEVAVPVDLVSQGGAQIAGLNFNLEFEFADLEVADVLLGQGASNAGKSASWSLPEPGVVRVLIAGLNQEAIADGELATIVFNVLDDATPGASALTLVDAIATDPNGNEVPLDLVDGVFVVASYRELLVNRSLEKLVPSPWRGSNSITIADGSDCSVANTGSCSATLTGSVGGQTKMLTYGLPGFSGSAGDSFDLTYYNKRDSVGGAGAIQVRVTIRYTDATTENFNYVPGVGTQDWQQYTENFTAAKDYNWGVVRLIFSKSNGTLWYDDMSLERNSSELLSNGTMEVVVPSPWKGSNSLTTSDGSDCTVANTGSCSATLTGSVGGQTKMLTYGLPGFGGSAGDEFTLSYFNKRDSVGGAGAIQVRVTLRYTDATLENFNYVPGVGTQDWQEYTESFTAAKNYNWGVVRLIYSKPNGQLWYDDISLLR